MNSSGLKNIELPDDSISGTCTREIWGCVIVMNSSTLQDFSLNQPGLATYAVGLG